MKRREEIKIQSVNNGWIVFPAAVSHQLIANEDIMVFTRLCDLYTWLALHLTKLESDNV